MLLERLCKDLRILLELIECKCPNRIAPLHRMMHLSAGECVLFVKSSNSQTSGKPSIRERSQRIRIETGSVTDMPRSRAAIAKVQRHGMPSMPRNNEGCSTKRRTAELNLHQV